MDNMKNYITKEVIEECLIECLEEIQVSKKEKMDNSKKES